MTAPLRHADLEDIEPLPFPDGRGRRSPDTRATLVIRDWTLVEAALVFYRGWSSAATARELHRALLRYRTGAWRRHCTEEFVPPKLVGRVEGLLWFILRQHDNVPSERTIRAALDRARKQHRW